MEVEPEQLLSLDIADAVQTLSYIWMPLVVIICLGGAWLVKR